MRSIAYEDFFTLSISARKRAFSLSRWAMSARNADTRVRAFCSSGSPRSLKTNEIANTTHNTLASRTTTFSVTCVVRRDSCVETDEDTARSVAHIIPP